MYEAVIAVCLSIAPGTCRDQLLPGYEAPDAAACQAALAARPPELPPAGVLSGAARCAPAGETIPFEEVAPGLFVHAGLVEEPDEYNLGDVSNIAFIVGRESVAVVDTGAARWIGEALWRSIRARTAKPVSHVILTHMHPDHVLGAGPFVEAGAKVVGHADLPRALADRAGNYLESLERLIGSESFLGTAPPLISETIGGRAEIDLGGRVLDLEAWTPAHTVADLTVFDRVSGVLVAGDLMFDRHTPALDGSLVGWRRALSDLKTRDLAGIVPGHGAALLDWPEGAEGLQRYLDVLERDTRTALERGERLGKAVTAIAAAEAPNWDLFEAYNMRNATVAYTELEWE
ncbi:quinoprotein relay system zinc metallohydrolase 2 [Rhodovulum imhoffii]|uniref:Quinoprotein relay system zinc metallohydrolase 2 n=1 Tax=Rhodovulum imhoffii TaxID=365340 RepID=A0A2T5BWP3_9RHOB|nr:quinoprotein relay system zinc metallohydrolase 2 [Rhodovulum imhoffii]MBK5933298.1 MBL fold metallo-hydrolase [Rhodovulum imhoffii]PTN04056.1 quinoprotein relay system zinc metallohydrolase 2 [Rhodovulum imhoffii]